MSQQEQQAEHDQHDKRDKTFNVTVRATNGATWATEFKENTKVAKVIREALDHFIAEGAMTDGDYRLALIVDGQGQPPLPEDVKLEDTAVEDGALLALVPRDPQVDG
jgi:hypothetical protein